MVPGEDLSVLYVVCPLMHSEKGPRGRLVLLCLCSLSPGVLKGALGEDLFVLL